MRFVKVGDKSRNPRPCRWHYMSKHGRSSHRFSPRPFSIVTRYLGSARSLDRGKDRIGPR
jgi:hypothetical protein